MKSPSRNCVHQACPFSQVAAESKVTGFPPSEPGFPFVTFPAFGVAHRSVTSAGKKDVGGERVLFCAGFSQNTFNLANRGAQVVECSLQASKLHAVQLNIWRYLGQSVRDR